MNPFYTAVAFWAAAFGCLTLGKVHPSKLRCGDARIIVTLFLTVMGVVSCNVLLPSGA